MLPLLLAFLRSAATDEEVEPQTVIFKFAALLLCFIATVADEMNMRDILSTSMGEELPCDVEVFLMGEEVAEYNGVKGF
ncbi:hypothetical protein F443_17957 [Phytophthora nicotianae P1569]|uniref:Uncharacterized protein n=1 Tax=Phytophthora nicotianae P1569 TaxID=1317065 RepID=V9EBS4_PHYNI|nr:hypothetical protein F443_17957 [Phytophthora nicotianae P1569]